jgi:uncharacterized protein YoaH (UPF0181 family)
MKESANPMPSDAGLIDTDRQHAIDEIQSLIDEGLASGPAQPFDMQAFLANRENGEP